MFTSWGRGFQRLAESHAASVAGDSLVTVALAGTLFFTVPSAEARENVALYLLLTLAPFAILGPLLARIFERSPGAYRGGLAVSALGRLAISLVLIPLIDTLWLFPLAFGLLVLSRFQGISRGSILPVVIDDPNELIAANARLARIGVLAGAVAIPVGVGAVALLGAWPALLLATIAYLISALATVQLPSVPRPRRVKRPPLTREERRPPRRVRLARFATAGVRFLNGFLLLIIAFAFRDLEAGVFSLGAILAAAGLGYYLAAWLAPALGSYVSEEPMVVAALAIQAGAAFIGAQVFSLSAAAVLAAAAGFAWGTAKFGFDGMLQSTMPPDARGRAFTNSETIFQIAWVLGALIPVLPFIPLEPGLAAAGILALIIQVVYVTLVLLPETARWRRDSRAKKTDDRDLLDLL